MVVFLKTLSHDHRRDQRGLGRLRLAGKVVW